MSNLKELLSVTLNPLARSFFCDDFSEEVTKYDDEEEENERHHEGEKEADGSFLALGGDGERHGDQGERQRGQGERPG